MLFENLPLSKSIQKSLQAKSYIETTPIQEKVIPEILRRNDIIGCAQTGTGKTGAYAIPVVNLLHKKVGTSKAPKKIQALVVCPTRELAVQIHENFTAYAKFTELRSAVVFGGTSMQPQIELLKKGVDILTATPGRLLDLRKQGVLKMDDINILVLDEADLMLEMGFIDDVKKIIRMAPNVAQRLLFSATIPQKVVELANTFLQDPLRFEITPDASTAETIDQKLYLVAKPDKNELLLHVLQNTLKGASVLIFRKTKYGVVKTLDSLAKNKFKAGSIHGDKSQSARQTVLNSFKAKEIEILVATDIAARGLDISNLDAVINFDIPNQPETYVHRIGRTGRAGKSGISISFCSPEEKKDLKDIEKLIGQKIDIEEEHPFQKEPNIAPTQQKKGSKHKKSRKGAGSKAKKKRWY